MLSPLRKSDPDFFDFEWLARIVAERQSNKAYTSGQYARPLVGIGLIAECTTDGTTRSSEPRWPTVAGQTVTDGSCVWTMRNPADVTLPSISGATYTITPAGITQTNPSTSGTVTRVKLDAANAAPGIYQIVAEITANGEDFSMADRLVVLDE
jgi:hypothetical protein